MANRAVIGKRTTPTTISDGTTTVNVLEVGYERLTSPPIIVRAVVRLANAVSFNSSANLTVTMPDGTTYVEDDWTYQSTGSYTTSYSNRSTPINAPLIKLNDYSLSNSKLNLLTNRRLLCYKPEEKCVLYRRILFSHPALFADSRAFFYTYDLSAYTLLSLSHALKRLNMR